MKVLELENIPLSTLRQMARELEVPDATRLKKEDLILRIQQAKPNGKGWSCARHTGNHERRHRLLTLWHYQPGPYDVYVSQSQIRRYNLRTGDLIIGMCAPARIRAPLRTAQGRNHQWLDPEDIKYRPTFESLTPIFLTNASTWKPIGTPCQPPDQPGFTNRARSTWPDRFTAQSRQDHYT